MNAAKYPRFKRVEDCECQCQCPPCTVTGEHVISRKAKRNGLVRVLVFCDCLFCGPFAYEAEREPVYIAGGLLRTQHFKPCRPLGSPRNAEMKPRD